VSPNWTAVGGVGGIYVEVIRNLPVLFSFCYGTWHVIAAYRVRGKHLLSARSPLQSRFVLSPPSVSRSLHPFLEADRGRIVGSLVLRHYARRELSSAGTGLIRIWPYVLGLLWAADRHEGWLFARDLYVELPQLRRFNFAGGSRGFPISSRWWGRGCRPIPQPFIGGGNSSAPAYVRP